MQRTPPLSVRRILRQEVGYGCPFEDCRSPFLEWHHFDPPWNVLEHQNPSGMIALCPTHHRQADAGMFTNADFSRMKTANWETISGAALPWTRRRMIFRCGGTILLGSAVLLSEDTADGPRAVVGMTQDDEGYLSVNFLLADPDGTELVRVVENEIAISPAVHDFESAASGRTIRAWVRNRQIGFEAEFDRLTLREIVENYCNNMVGGGWPLTDLAEHQREYAESLGPLPDYVRDWSGVMVYGKLRPLADSDGRYATVTLNNLRINYRGIYIEMTNRVVVGGMVMYGGVIDATAAGGVLCSMNHLPRA